MKMRFEKCRQLIGSAALEKLKNAKVAVFGVGGVGGFVAEALARSGVGGLCLVDKDVVDETNVNRQIVALTDTIGMYKTDVMKERIHSIPGISLSGEKLSGPADRLIDRPVTFIWK